MIIHTITDEVTCIKVVYIPFMNTPRRKRGCQRRGRRVGGDEKRTEKGER